MTHHAREVAARRGVGIDDIVECLAEPDVTEPHEHLTRFVRGNLAVVADASSPEVVVVTILLRRREPWADRDVRFAMGKAAS